MNALRRGVLRLAMAALVAATPGTLARAAVSASPAHGGYNLTGWITLSMRSHSRNQTRTCEETAEGLIKIEPDTQSSTSVTLARTCAVVGPGYTIKDYWFTTKQLEDGQPRVPRNKAGGLNAAVVSIDPPDWSPSPSLTSDGRAAIQGVSVPQFLVKHVTQSVFQSGPKRPAVNVVYAGIDVPATLVGGYQTNADGVITLFGGEETFGRNPAEPYYNFPPEGGEERGTLTVRWHLVNTPLQTGQ